MKLFKIKTGDEKVSDKAAAGIASAILKLQRWFAGTAEKFTGRWKQKQQWVFLSAVCLLFGSLSIAAIINSFQKPETSKSVIPKQIAVPKTLYKENSLYEITESEFQQVQQYKQSHPNLIKERPGLYDSLTLIEQAYYSQKNK